MILTRDRWILYFQCLLLFSRSVVMQVGIVGASSAGHEFWCSFDGGTLCNMTQSTTDERDWILNSGPTPTSGTGPEDDVAGGGTYIYFTAGRYTQGYSATITSPSVAPAVTNCSLLSFWYHGYGNNLGMLKADMDVGGTLTNLWNTTGKSYNGWQSVAVHFLVTTNFKVKFMASSTGYVKGDYAVDEIKVTSCSSDVTSGPLVFWTPKEDVLQIGNSTVNKMNGIILSPNWPNTYPDNYRYTWFLTVDSSKRMRIVGIDVDLESGDTLKISKLGSGFTYTITKPFADYTIGNTSEVEFVSDKSGVARGFNITWESFEKDPVNIITNAFSGEIKTPFHPSVYPHNYEQWWKIQVPTGYIISFKTNNTYVRLSSGDYLKIFDDFNGTTSLGSFRSYVSTASSSNVASVQFYSDFYYNAYYTGFDLKWKAIALSSTYLNGNDGNFTYPGYPGFYPEAVVYKWFISVETTRVISFRIGPCFLKGEDNLKVYSLNDDDSRSFELKSFSYTHSTPESLLSDRHKAEVVFYSDLTETKENGFFVYWSKADPNLQSTYTGFSSELIKPQHSPYKTSFVYRWLVAPPNDTIVSYVVYYTNLESCCDTLQIWYYDATKTRVNEYTSTGTRSYAASGSLITTLMEVYFYSDNMINYADGFSLRWVVIGKLETSYLLTNNASGLMTSPGYPAKYNESFQKSWILTVPEGLTIDMKLYVRSFGNGDYIKIYDINSNHTRVNLIKQFSACSWCSWRSWSSSGNSVEVYMYSDVYDSDSGFALGWAISTIPYQNFTLTNVTGEITSPSYPGYYPNSVRLRWFVIGPEDSVLSFRVSDLVLEACCDFLEIYEIDAISKSRSQRLYRNDGKKKMTSSTQALEFSFFSDPAITYQRGFALTYVIIRTTNISYLNKTTTGIIQAPNFPGVYPLSVVYRWIITLPEGETLSLKITTRSLEEAFDFLKIYEIKNNTRTALLGQYTDFWGFSNSFVLSTSSSTEIFFFSDIDIAYNSGFYLGAFSTNIENKTVSIYNQSSGEITSPNYPLAYPEACRYFWEVKVNHTDSYIGLILNHAHLEMHYDKLQVMDSQGKIVQDYTGLTSELSSKSLIPSTEMKIYFYSDEAITYEKGFSITWQELRVVTSHINAIQSGLITSPGYPNFYPTAYIYKWFITVSAGSRVYMKITDVYTETCCDYLQIYNLVNGTRQGEVTAQLSFILWNAFYTSATNTVEVFFISDMRLTYRGFSLGWHSTGLAHTLSTINGSSSGEILSPNYPQQYSSPIKHSWVIQAQQASSWIGVKLVSLDLEDCCDNVTGYLIDSAGTKTLLDLKALWSTFEKKFLSKNPSLEIFFYADPAISAGGFKILWTELPLTSHSITNEKFGKIDGPGYPGSYRVAEQHQWLITVQAGARVIVKLLELNIELNWDEFRITEGSADSNVNLCSGASCSPLPLVVQTATSNKMSIVFTSDIDTVYAKSFYLGWSSSQTDHVVTTVAGLSGVIISPNYPSTYNDSSQHSWTISCPSNHAVNIKLVDIDLETGYDFLEIRKVKGGSKTVHTFNGYLNGRMTGSLPSLTSSWLDNVDQVEIYFNSDPAISSRGFKLHWALSEILVPAALSEKELGSFKTPHYGSGNYSVGFRHSWTITTTNNLESDFQILIKIEEVDLEFCCDTFQITEYNSGVTMRTITLSTASSIYNDNPKVNYLTVKGPTFAVNLDSDASSTGRGVALSWMTLPLAHNKEDVAINDTVRSGFLISPQYSSAYPPGFQYSWFFNTSAVNGSYSISFLIVTLRMENCCDYIEVFDLDEDGNRVASRGRLSGADVTHYTMQDTTSSFVELYFYSDPSIVSEGFTLVWVARSTVPTTILTFFDTPGNTPEAVAACVIVLVAVVSLLALICYCTKTDSGRMSSVKTSQSNKKDIVLEDVEEADGKSLPNDNVTETDEGGSEKDKDTVADDQMESLDKSDKDTKGLSAADADRGDMNVVQYEVLNMSGTNTPAPFAYDTVNPERRSVASPSGVSASDVTPLDVSYNPDGLYNEESYGQPLKLATEGGLDITIAPKTEEIQVPKLQSPRKKRFSLTPRSERQRKSLLNTRRFSVPADIAAKTSPNADDLPRYDMDFAEENGTHVAPSSDQLYGDDGVSHPVLTQSENEVSYV